MGRSRYLDLSRRERQIMDAVYRVGRASVSEVLAEIPDPPSYSSVRAIMGKLEEKGQLAHEQEGARYIYFATQPRGEARETALRRLMKTFFDGSPSKAVAAVLDVADDLGPDELDELEALIRQAREGGR